MNVYLTPHFEYFLDTQDSLPCIGLSSFSEPRTPEETYLPATFHKFCAILSVYDIITGFLGGSLLSFLIGAPEHLAAYVRNYGCAPRWNQAIHEESQRSGRGVLH